MSNNDLEVINSIKNKVKSSSIVLKGTNFLVYPESANENYMENAKEILLNWNLEKELEVVNNFFQDKTSESKKNSKNKYEEELSSYYYLLADKLEDVFIKYESSKKIIYDDVSEIAKALLVLLKNQKNELINYVKFPKLNINSLTLISLNTSLISSSIGLQMNLSNYKLIELCCAGLLHKIGFLELSKNIRENREEISFNRQYPVLGYKILRENNFPQALCITIYNQKENLDGSGYPRALKGQDINIEANIIGASSSYVEMTLNKRTENQDFKDFETCLVELVKEVDKKFDKRVLKLLINILSKYPLDSIVRLKNSDIAKVVEIDFSNTREPFIIKLIENSKIINLKVKIQALKESENEIVKILSKNEIEQLKNTYNYKVNI